MSKSRYKWWGYVKNVIRAYPEHGKRLNDLRQQSVTAAYSVTPKSKTPSRTVENAALRELAPDERKEFEAVQKAIDKTARIPDGDRRVELVDMVFWKRTHTLQGAADALFISYGTAKRWHNSFIVMTAKNLLPEQFEDTPY